MYYYHVISDTPKRNGEHIILDSEHPNGAYQRVYAQLDVVQDIYLDPEKYAGADLGHEIHVALRELVLEKIRKEKYPQYPSRMASLYVSRTYEGIPVSQGTQSIKRKKGRHDRDRAVPTKPNETFLIMPPGYSAGGIVYC